VLYTREHLRHRLKGSRHGLPEGWLEGDQAAFHDDARPAAVLIGFVARPNGPTLLLTKRTDHLRDHAGQICLPGGRVEEDDPGVVEAALREAEEEIGLEPAKVEVIGELKPYITTTGFRIHPVVGWIEPPVTFKLDPFEVAEVFELPLAFVLDVGNHRRQRYRRGAQSRTYYVLPYEGRFIWGATAGILVNLAQMLSG
jgi:8-oxo-dGTP pyrophosphatase MutT (NUDIX family)